MNLITQFCQNSVVPTITVLVLSTTASANAVVVNIDPNQSSVTYNQEGFKCDAQGNCGPLSDPQTFILSGSFNIIQQTPVWLNHQTIQFDTLAVDSGDAAALGFSLPAYPGLMMNGEDFIADDNPCLIVSPTTSCTWVSDGREDNFSGTFDGTTLSMTGNKYTYDHSFSRNWFNFTIVAHVGNLSPVPEPETYAMLIAGLGLLGWRLRRGTVKPPLWHVLSAATRRGCR
jgi:hypothetical protein